MCKIVNAAPATDLGVVEGMALAAIAAAYEVSCRWGRVSQLLLVAVHTKPSCRSGGTLGSAVTAVHCTRLVRSDCPASPNWTHYVKDYPFLPLA